MTETESTTHDSGTRSPAVNNLRRIRPRRRHIVWSAVAVVTAGLVVGLIWFIRFAPLEPGSVWGPATSTTDAWQLDHAFLDSRQTVIARNEHLARVDLEFSVRNTSGFAVKLLDPGPGLESAGEPTCGWQAADITFSVPSSYDDFGTELDPPFTLRSHEEVTVHVTGRIGAEELGPCEMAGIGWAPIELPIRYSFLGIARAKHIPLDLIIGLSDDPETFLEVDVNELEPLD